MSEERPGNSEESVTPRNSWGHLRQHRSAGGDVHGSSRFSSGSSREGLAQMGPHEATLHQDVVRLSVWWAVGIRAGQWPC